MPAEIVLTRNIRPGQEPPDLKAYERAGGYQALRKALSSMTPQAVQEAVKKSGLRGRGGAGFPTGAKWSFVPLGKRRAAAEIFHRQRRRDRAGDFQGPLSPGRRPAPGHRRRHPQLPTPSRRTSRSSSCAGSIARRRARWRRPSSEAAAAGYLGKNILGSGYSLPLHLHVSAGRYICGEESALINSLEGRRAVPRAKPPHPTVCGLWGKPTIVNNVETVANVPHIVLRGAEWFAGLSLGADSGTKLYSASGRVKNPGVWELPMGTPMREMLEGARRRHARGLPLPRRPARRRLDGFPPGEIIWT